MEEPVRDEAIKNEVQRSIEKTAELSDMLFGAPPLFASYALILVSGLSGLLLAPRFEGLVEGFLLVALPGLIAAAASAPLVTALGGTFYHQRSAFLAALGAFLVALCMASAEITGWVFAINPVHGVLLGYALALALRHSVLYVMADNRHRRCLPTTLLPYLAATPMMVGLLPLGPREVFLLLALPLLYIGSSVFFLRIFDAPMRKNFGVSAFDLFRYFLDHFHTGNPMGETILEALGEPIQAKVGVVAFRRQSDRKVKACIVVPALHPGPVGELGGGDMPGKIASGVTRAAHVLVPHGAATHDLNPISTREVDKVGRAVDEALARMEFTPGGSRFAGEPKGVRVGSQVFGDGALLTYTSWPEPIDDVSYGVGLAAELSAQLGGVHEAIFVDCHNSLTPGAGAVFMCTPRADRIIDLAREATEEAMAHHVAEVRVGVAQVTGFRREDGIGKQGVQALVVDAGGQRTAYVLWDGNNMLPEVAERIGEALAGLVDKCQVMSTDNHSVNLVAGGFNPIGHRLTPERVAEATRDAVREALDDLEPVDSGADRLTIPGLRVFGHDKTARLTSSVNTMVSLAPQVFIAWVLVAGMATALLLYGTRALG